MLALAANGRADAPRAAALSWVSACVPAPPGGCDNHDDCPSQHACLFETGTCVPLCLEDGTCADPGLTCHTCATSSCPDCNDCVTGCLAD